MARVNVKLDNGWSSAIGKLARRCKGEFYGSSNGMQITFGFANRNHAKLFVNALKRQMKVDAVVYA